MYAFWRSRVRSGVSTRRAAAGRRAPYRVHQPAGNRGTHDCDQPADRAADPAVRALAEQIEAAQAPEIATMTGWLAAWGEPTAPPSRGMGGGHDMAAMPGMMSAEDMVGLEAVSAADFDRMFLTMMIRHHEGAIEMARTEQSDGRFPDTVALAQTIETAQVAEIETMRGLLGNA